MILERLVGVDWMLETSSRLKNRMNSMLEIHSHIFSESNLRNPDKQYTFLHWEYEPVIKNAQTRLLKD